MNSHPAYLTGRGRGRGRGFDQNRQNNAAPGQRKSDGGRNSNSNAWGNRHTKAPPDPVQSVEERFQQASRKFQENAKQHLNEINDDLSSEDEDDIADGVLQTIFKTYSTSYNDGESNDVNKAQDILLHTFRSGTSACLICIENIKKEDAIWNCDGCSCMFHLVCIQKWVREGVHQHIYQSEENNPSTDIPWYCPKCRFEYKQSQCPKKYYCFCGKETDPKFDPWLVPHSCGNACERKLKPNCGHSCLLLCHPGACPPCPKTVKTKCHCGKQQPAVMRCSSRTWSCGQPCHHLLSCGHHNCQQVCHEGDCEPCSKTSVQKCLCGKSAVMRPCADSSWQCDEPCGKRLSCGSHLCETVCHSGPCGKCPRLGRRKCPCGKTEFDLPCTEDIPTCGDSCEKMLNCGIHSCSQRCHYGQCGTCLQVTVKKCRCGQRQKEVPCQKEYLCEVKCSNLRDCGKHQCKRKCCDGNCPSCEQTCGKPLACRNHKCASRCHRGPCYPCPLSVEIFCFCKSSHISVPCGREKTTRPPRCNVTCRIPPDCHHPARLKHRCHFGECPPCRQICNINLPNCTHVCPVQCHSAVKQKTKENIPRVGPWEGKATIKIEKVNKPCPPCKVLVPVQCLGKHEISQFECAIAKPYSCSSGCGRQLLCGNHDCSFACHDVLGSPENNQAGSNCETCELACEKPRPDGCSHRCSQNCHPGTCPPCKQMIRMRCHCSVVQKYVNCHQWTHASPKEKDGLKICGGECPKKLTCGHQCQLLCHSGQCSNPNQCERKVALKCKCKRRKKDFFCKDVQNGEDKLKCDDICRQVMEKKQKEKEEEEKLIKEEELKKQQAELEAFERKMKGGRKRKPRKEHTQEVKKGFLETYKQLTIISLSVTVLAIFVVFLFSS